MTWNKGSQKAENAKTIVSNYDSWCEAWRQRFLIGTADEDPARADEGQ